MGYAGAKEKKREQLLSIAEELMMKYGPEETSYQEIGEKAGVTRQTVCNYFSTKENLYIAILERNRDRMSESLDAYYNSAAFQRLTGYEQIVQFILYEIYRVRYEGPYMLMINRVALALGKNYRKLERTRDISCVWQKHRLIRRSVEKGYRDGSIDRSVMLTEDEIDASVWTTQAIRLYLAQQLFLTEEEADSAQDHLISLYEKKMESYIKTLLKEAS